MQSHWKPRRLRRISFTKRRPVPPEPLLYAAAILSVAGVVLSTGIAAYTAITGPPGKNDSRRPASLCRAGHRLCSPVTVTPHNYPYHGHPSYFSARESDVVIVVLYNILNFVQSRSRLVIGGF